MSSMGMESGPTQRLVWPTFAPAGSLAALGLILAGCAAAAAGLNATLPARDPELPWLFYTGGLGAFIALPIVKTVVLNAPPPRTRPAAYALTHVLGLGSFYFVHVLCMRGLRLALDALFATTLVRGDLVYDLRIELQRELLVYVAAALYWTAQTLWEGQQRAAVRAAELEARLQESRLAALSAKLDPHFLYNALNTVTAIMHVDVARAERLIADLGGLLRDSLRDTGATWPLADELAHTRRYLAFIEARFGDRVCVSLDVESGLDMLEVPRFVLQALVENAVKHNQHERRQLRVVVSAQRRGDQLELRAQDDGRGFEPGTAERRGGLTRLEETLALLHGAAAHLRRTRTPSGGADVQIVLPGAP
jgi:two-component system, LytTR family, sensor kinase